MRNLRGMTTSYNRLSFSNEEEFKLIEFIKNHPALWDASNEEYTNAELRKLYWITLSKELNKSVFECRRKWRFVRDYYIHKRRRQSESTPQRDGKYFSLQFLNKVKVFSKKNSCQKNIKRKKNIIESPEAELLGTDEEIDYDYLDDPTVEKITVERIGDENSLRDQDTNTINEEHDDKSDDFIFKEDYILDEESSMVEELEKLENTVDETDAVEEDEEIDGGDNENVKFEHGTRSTQTDSIATGTSKIELHNRAIDLFFESMAAAVKTFPPQYIAEAKCKVFMAINEVESKVYRNTNKN